MTLVVNSSVNSAVNGPLERHHRDRPGPRRRLRRPQRAEPGPHRPGIGQGRLHRSPEQGHRRRQGPSRAGLGCRRATGQRGLRRCRGPDPERLRRLRQPHWDGGRRHPDRSHRRGRTRRSTTSIRSAPRSSRPRPNDAVDGLTSGRPWLILVGILALLAGVVGAVAAWLESPSGARSTHETISPLRHPPRRSGRDPRRRRGVLIQRQGRRRPGDRIDHHHPRRRRRRPTCDPPATASYSRRTPGARANDAKLAARSERKGQLVVGVSADTYGFGFRNPLTGDLEGFDIDMAHAVAKAIFGDPIDVVDFRVDVAGPTPSRASSTTASTWSPMSSP